MQKEKHHTICITLQITGTYQRNEGKVDDNGNNLNGDIAAKVGFILVGVLLLDDIDHPDDDKDEQRDQQQYDDHFEGENDPAQPRTA